MAVQVSASNDALMPPDLLERATRGNLLLFLADRIVCDVDGGVAVDQWRAQLVERCCLNDMANLNFSEVAQMYEDKEGRAALVQFVHDQPASLNTVSQPVRALVAGLVK